MDGTIITANENFQKALGYSLAEMQGKHHSMFVEPAMRSSEAYREFWAKLNRGDYHAGEYKQIGKSGDEVWIQASYNPVFRQDAKPFKVIKFATDITSRKMRSMEDAGKIAAIQGAQAVIEFNMDGRSSPPTRISKKRSAIPSRKCKASTTACFFPSPNGRAQVTVSSGPL